MTATNQIPQHSKAIEAYRSYQAGYSKTLSTGPAKSLGGGYGVDPALGAWVEENRYVYDAIMNGTSDLSPVDQSQFMEWWGWAMNQLQGASSGWDPTAGGQPMGAGQQALPAGAIPGANGNAIYDQMDATINHTPYGQPIDIYSNNIVLNSGSMMTTFTCEVTTDTRLQPAEQVLKITASDGTTYLVHDYEDAEIVIKTPIEDMLVNNSGLSNVSWAEYTGAAGGTSGNGWTGGETEKIDETHYVVTGMSGETIDVTPNKNVDEPVNVEFYGDVNITLPADCTADVTSDGPLTVTVKDRDGNVIAVYTVHNERGNTCQINGFATINGEEPTITTNEDDEEVIEGPEGLNINGTETDGSSSGIGVIGVDFAENLPIAALTETSYESLPAELKALVDALNWPHDEIDGLLLNIQVNSAFRDALAPYIGEDNKLSAAEMQKAIQEKAFPPPGGPNGEMTGFFVAMDPQLVNLLVALESASGPSQAQIMEQISNRYVQLLQALYPGHEIRMEKPNTGDIRYANNIVFDGVVFEAFSEGNNGPVGTNAFNWYGPPA
jgi:hypothetical protein